MSIVFLESQDIVLEPFDKKHITDNYIAWLNNPKTTQYNSHGIFPYTQEKAYEFLNNTSQQGKIVLAIIDKETCKHIGNAAIDKIDFINSSADLTILIGDTAFWGKGVAKNVFNMLLIHCFDTLNLHRVSAGTTQDNMAMQKVLEQLGFTKEGISKEAIQRNGKFINLFHYGLLKENRCQ